MFVGFFDELGDSKFVGVVDCYEEIEFVFSGLYFCNIYMEEVYGILFELLVFLLVVVDVR